MEINLWINGKEFKDDVLPDTVLIDFIRSKGFYSVKRGCETSNCGLCTVLMDGKPILSCSTLALRGNGHDITTIEGIEEEALEFGGFMADQGAEQCGFCSPGFIMTVIAMKNELTNPSEEEIKNYLNGNLCRCTGYMGQLRAIKKYLEKGSK
ncbi:MAG: (2Fe-2S)-binding protein [Tissierellia bacterium]|nr:(2Fe-2S)-binding protein [Tissierellia bacterium]MDD4779543.1 (2Fe-2S)-binding protein [Tissierellia bacterium]